MKGEVVGASERKTMARILTHLVSCLLPLTTPLASGLQLVTAAALRKPQFINMRVGSSVARKVPKRLKLDKQVVKGLDTSATNVLKGVTDGCQGVKTLKCQCTKG